MAQIACKARITGRVQGVSYRAWTRDKARGLNLSGWVRNLPDGSVEAHLQGDEAALRQMLSELKTGPTFAQVGAVQSTPVAPEPGTGFEIRR